MEMRQVHSFLLLAFLLAPPAAAGALAPGAEVEIRHLLLYVEQSGCEFYRNGSWYGAEAAEEHLRLKYEFLKNSLDGAEDFIEKAASRSSLSGQAYQVNCGPDGPVPSARWLRRELLRFRATASQS